MRTVSISELRAGDVLLCYGGAKFNPIGKAISHVTNSEYTHAAICIDSCTAAESTVLGGVAKAKAQDIVKRYDHVAVFRQPDAWEPSERVRAMNAFIDSIIASKAKYNLHGVIAYIKEHRDHQLSLTEQLHAFFAGKPSPKLTEKSNYFCSELVADCFVATGFIAPSAAVVYKPEYTSPGALGRDVTFGTFYGYVSAVTNYSVPATDEFFNAPTFCEIFGK